MLTRWCCFLLLLLLLLACRLGGGTDDRGAGNGSEDSDSPNSQLCRKYESCGCQSYKDCIEDAKKSPALDKPGVRECMLASSCESLCAGKPDGCMGQSASEGGSGGAAAAPSQKSNCAAISCSKNSDCPSDCYGGCDGVRCYSF